MHFVKKGMIWDLIWSFFLLNQDSFNTLAHTTIAFYMLCAEFGGVFFIFFFIF